MRIVAVALLAAAAVLVSARQIAAECLSSKVPDELPAPAIEQKGAGANVESPADSGAKSNHVDFVYVPPPAEVKTDPKFHAGIFEFIPETAGQPGGKLVPPVWGAIPAASGHASPNVGKSHIATSTQASSPAEPKPTSTATAKQTATPVPSSTSSSKLIQFVLTAKPTSILPAAATVTPSPTKTPSPAPTLVATAKTQLVASVPKQLTVQGYLAAPSAYASGSALDIEDPRFYRGSYVYDPETRTLKPAMIGSAPEVAGKSSTSGGCTGGSASASSCAITPGTQSGGTFPRRGRAMYYNPGIMEQVLAFRLQAQHVTTCPECIGFVALLNREDLNRKVWLEWEDGDVEGPFLTIDVAAKHHVPSLLQRNWVVDVDYATALRRGMNRPLPVTVWDRPPLAKSPLVGG